MKKDQQTPPQDQPAEKPKRKKRVAVVGVGADVRQQIAAQIVSGKNDTAVFIEKDGSARVVNIAAVRELHTQRQEDIRGLKAQLQPAPLELLRNGANRNRPCPCGSGKKFKKCCWLKSEQRLTITP